MHSDSNFSKCISPADESAPHGKQIDDAADRVVVGATHKYANLPIREVPLAEKNKLATLQ